MFDSNGEERPITIMERIFSTIWRSIIVGIAYTFTTFFLGGFLSKIGIDFPDMASLGISRLWFLGAAILMGFVVGGISQIVHTSKLNHILSWTILLFLNPCSVTLESAFLTPQLLNPKVLPALMLVQFIAALVTAVLITFLFASSSKQSFGSYIKRHRSVWGMRISMCIGLALLLYSLFSATNYREIPTLYFDNYQVQIPIPGVEVIFAIQFMRAVLVVLSLIPMIITIGATKRFIAVMSGIALVVLGSVSPFLQVSNLSMFLLLASSGMIFLQNFLIGLFVGFILGHPSKLEEEGISIIDYLRPILREALYHNAEFFKEQFKSFKLKKPETNNETEIIDSNEAENLIKKRSWFSWAKKTDSEESNLPS